MSLQSVIKMSQFTLAITKPTVKKKGEGFQGRSWGGEGRRL